MKIKTVFWGGAVILAAILVTRFVPYDLPAKKQTPSAQVPSSESFRSINRAYLKTVKPIFEAKCLMCHGQVAQVPLYAVIPPASWLVHADMRDAKKRIDMTYDFPFRGEDSQKANLKAIREVVKDGSMPPFQYLLMHWESSLTDSEKKRILEWVQQSLQSLGQEGT